MDTRDLLIEIGTEELPPKALKKLSRAFHDGVLEGIKSAELSHGGIQQFASPRRLALLVYALQEKQQDKQVERRGPALTAAFDEEGCPTKAASGFARSCGVEVDQLDKIETDKGSWLAYSSEQKGEPASRLIPDIVNKALDTLPIPKRMRWGSLKEQFVRPVHWAILLFGDEVIETEILSVKSGRETRGHRFHHPKKIYIGEPAAYAPLLESQAFVIADFAERRAAIRGQVLEIAKEVNGQAVIDEALLDEVTSMVEWPQAVLGNFDKRFLDVPSEALISAMKSHQKYFHVVDEHGKLMPHFITISNIVSKEPDKVREGNERVIRPRLSDAEFFWEQDKKLKLIARNERLKTIVFQNKLGTVYDKVIRLTELSAYIATCIGWDDAAPKRAANLCKADLTTDMVGEFPELQGIMGSYYARLDGEDEEVAQAIDEHYMPRFSGDKLPETQAGLCAALADKLDTLVGIFAIGQSPSGDKDPFALRRAALGVLRIIIEKDLDLDLDVIIKSAIKNYTYQRVPIHIEDTTTLVYEFILARLQVYYNNLGYAHDEIDAVLSLKPGNLQDADKRLRALAEFRKLPEAESLAAANKRISNILKKTRQDIPDKWNIFVLTDNEEKTLANTVDEMIPELEPLYEKHDYETAMKELAGLRQSVDDFFDEVMVMTEDETLRANRLALLTVIRNLFLRVADLSRLQ
jgi:glycyl-tRNA synthetase beta chain